MLRLFVYDESSSVLGWGEPELTIGFIVQLVLSMNPVMMRSLLLCVCAMYVCMCHGMCVLSSLL